MQALPLEEIKEKPPTNAAANIVSLKKGAPKKQTSGVIDSTDIPLKNHAVKRREKILPSLKTESSLSNLDRTQLQKLAHENALLTNSHQN